MAEKLTDEQVEDIARRFIQSALGRPESDIGRARDRNLRYYNADPSYDLAPPEIEDRSNFVATDVADTVEWMLPQLMRMFVTSDDAVEFEARRPDGEQQAQMATAYVNYLFYVRNPGQEVLYDWFKDALLQKVGFCKVWAEQEKDGCKESYTGMAPEQLQMLLQDGYQIVGQPEQSQDGTLSFTVEKDYDKVAIKIAAVPPHEMRIDANARWGAEPKAIGQEMFRTRSELEQEGYDLSDVSPSGTTGYESEAREMLGPAVQYQIYDTPHESFDLFKFAEVYLFVDKDGDGDLEWIKVCLIEEKIAILDGKPDVDEIDDHPFVWTCPAPRPHAFFGDCPADWAIAPQKMHTDLVRALMDNLYLSVNNGTYVNMSAGVQLDDLLDNRPNRVVRGNQPPSEAIAPLVQPNLGEPVYKMIEYVQGWKEDRTGFTKYSQGSDANSLNRTATGVSIITQKADMRMEMVARFFAVGVKDMFRKILKLATRYQVSEDMVKLNGQWVALNPSEWKDQFNVSIKVGLGTGTKEQTMQRIMAMAQLMQMGTQVGVVRPEQWAELIKLGVEANEFKNPERFVDPQPSGMPPNPQAYQQQIQGMQQHIQQQGQQLQQVSQENMQLKAERSAKQGELQIRAMEVQQKGQEVAIKTATAHHQIGISERKQSVDEHMAMEDQRVQTLEQQVSAMEQMLKSLTGGASQSQGQNGDTGPDPVLRKKLVPMTLGAAGPEQGPSVDQGI